MTGLTLRVGQNIDMAIYAHPDWCDKVINTLTPYIDTSTENEGDGLAASILPGSLQWHY